jgi:flagellar FliL protein
MSQGAWGRVRGLFPAPAALRRPQRERDLGFDMAAKAKAKAGKEPEEDADVAEGAEGTEAASPPKRKLPLKLMAIIGAGVVLVAGVGTGAYFLIGSVGKSHAAPVPVKPAVFVDLPEVLVNLSNTGSDRTQYLKVKVVLELSDQLLMQQITPILPRVMDTFQTYLRELRPTDLDGSAGLYRLKEELTRRVNVAIAPNKVNAVLFKEIIVQ